MSLYQSPPEALEIDGVQYPIDTDFRTWIEFQSIITKNNSTEEKTADLLQFIAALGLPFSENTFTALIDFFSGGDKRKSNGDKSKKQAYDFDTDSSLIFSAFLTQYKTDLTTEKIHWWKFKAMFASLSKEHMISTVMWARTADTKDMSKAMKDYVADINKSYPLDVNNSVHKMTLEERNKMWFEYVERRYKEAQKSRMSALSSDKQSGVD